MTDVRAILERESRSLKWRTALTVAFVLVWGAFLLWVGFHRLQRGLTVGNLIGAIAPLAGLSAVVVGYSNRHRQALAAAVEDPDPALDAHFAAALEADEDDVANLARGAFLRRFSARLPALDEAGWRSVVGALPGASPHEAKGLLRILGTGAPPSAIAGIEAFAATSPDERSRTDALSTLGGLRLRTARARVLEVEEEGRTRLRL